MTTSSSEAYVPGVCNINRAEIAYRRKAGHFGLALYIVLLGVLVILPIGRWIRLVLFVPSFVAAIGYLQARNKFCVSYAASGQQNAAEGSHKALPIADAKAKAVDTRKARRMNLQAAGIASAATCVALLVPHM